ncbi:MAG TPA: hypothetical protein VG245_06445 [Candidatus Dormibacteraeota bacterium]|jgi:hypothetical protein|nr:hypothetical protein [Candidatus Dormibacteraeota bacterium]
MLRLNRETVRDLSAGHLSRVGGGTSGDVCTVETAATAFISPATAVATAVVQAGTDAYRTATLIASAEVGGCYPSGLLNPCFAL